MKDEPIRPWLRTVAAVVLVGAAFFFLGREILRNLDQLRGFEWQVRPVLLLASVVALSLVLLGGTWIWKLVLVKFGISVPLRPLARAWFLSNLSRYIPGTVWQFVSLAGLSAQAGVPAATAVTSLLVHVGFTVLSGALAGVWLLPPELAGKLAPALAVARWASPLAIACVHPAIIRRLVSIAQRLGRGARIPWQGSWVEGVGFLMLGCLSWLAYGAAFYLFLLAFTSLPPSAYFALAAINALAFLVGFAAVFAPGGIGFKEAAMGLLLAGLVPAGVAAALAIAARLWSIAAEVVPALVLARREPPIAIPPSTAANT